MAGKFSAPRTPKPDPAPQPVQAEKPQQDAATVRRGPRVSTLIFYTAYVMLILFFILGMNRTLKDLEQKLVDYEASQPIHQSETIFLDLFSQPDWAALYDLAQIPDTVFEGRDAFAVYMTDRVGSQALTYQEVPSDLTDVRQYTLLAGDTPIGSFTLVADTTVVPTIWSPEKLELVYEYNESVRIQKLSDHTVYINGIPLDDSHTIRTTSVCDETYLPRGVYNVWVHTQQVNGLMIEPTVTAVDSLGQPVDVIYDPETDTYITADSTTAYTDEEQAIAQEALKAYVKYKVNRFTPIDISPWFDTESDYYALLSAEPLWTSSNLEPTFANETVSGFYRCSDKVFCIWLDMSAYVNRTNGTLKEYNLSQTMLFRKGENGWQCIGITDRDPSILDPQVRITFMNGDTLLSSEYYPEDSATLMTPLLGTGDENVLTGWYCPATGETFIPDSNGLVTIPDYMTLAPMVLYAQFNHTNSEVNE